MNKSNVLLLNQVGIHDTGLVGEKNALLGEMLQHVAHKGINIPPGFVITVNAYNSFISYNGLGNVIASVINEIDFANPGSFQRSAHKIRSLISNARFPPELSQEIIETYYEFSESYGHDVTDVAVRSSAVAKGLNEASFTRQHQTFLNVRGPVALLDAIRNCFASLFTGRAILYRNNIGFDHLNAALSVCVQKMVRSDLGASGMAFTETRHKDAIVINASYGLGELIVHGDVLPDAYIVYRPTGNTGSLIEKRLGVKDQIMVYGDDTSERVKIIAVEKELQTRFCLEDDVVRQLADRVIKIEEYYSNILEEYTLVDIEWAIDGISKELFIVQTKPSGQAQATVSTRQLVNSSIC